MAGNDQTAPVLPRTVADIAIDNLRAMANTATLVAGADIPSGSMVAVGYDGLARAAGAYATFKQMAARDWAIFNAPLLTIDEEQVRREFGLEPVAPPAPRPEPVTRATRPKR